MNYCKVVSGVILIKVAFNHIYLAFDLLCSDYVPQMPEPVPDRPKYLLPLILCPF